MFFDSSLVLLTKQPYSLSFELGVDGTCVKFAETRFCNTLICNCYLYILNIIM